MMKVPLVFASVALLLSASAPRAGCEMCSCGPGQYTPREARRRAQAVFLGRVTRVVERPLPIIDSPRSDSARRAYTEWALERFRITLDVQRVWKGKVGTVVDVVTGSHPGACGVAFDLEENYVVYADRAPAGHWYTSICDRTRLAANAESDFAELGRGVAPDGASAPVRPPHN